ncbi:hypothetical protein E2C01_061790 [Portunus trituberculatus]|uniref:Uncharacterized protein n=1 Tax=Portunus trituberculatus TaxID=210409 RepID=A0A5B7HBY9_PORTR|nr:hypothetical protein [Portunus trituberculatus]
MNRITSLLYHHHHHQPTACRLSKRERKGREKKKTKDETGRREEKGREGWALGNLILPTGGQVAENGGAGGKKQVGYHDNHSHHV